jgi:amino acid adenylation domain-containing protein
MNQVIEGYRLSPRQRRLWGLRGAGGAWATLRVRGCPAGEPLERALEEVARRSEILRTRFVREPRTGIPLQVIGEAAVAWEPAEDWSGDSPERVESLLTERMEAALRHPFDLEEGAPLRAGLVRTGPDEHLLLVHAPALAADAATMGLLADELARAFAGDAPSAEAMQYADVSEWQLEAAESEEAAEGRRFWQTRARPEGADLRLPGEASGGAWAPRTLRLAMEPGLLAELEGAAARLEVPLPDLLLAAFHVLLHRLTLREQVVVSAAFDGRGFEELREAPGPFGLFLPVAAAVSPELPVADVVRAVAAAVAETRPWQDFHPAGEADAAPPTSAAFAWVPALPEAGGGGATFAADDVWVAAERFALALFCQPGPDGLALRVLFDAGALPAGEAGRIADAFHALLRGLAADPSATVGGLDLLSPAERGRVLGELAPGAAPAQAPGTVIDWIVAQAARTPARAAVACEGESLTYAELVRRIDRRAARLRAAGVGPEVRVAVVGGRSADTLVSLLAVLRAGGAYVPLDRAYPADRLRFVLDDAGGALVVADGPGAEAAAASGLPILRTDEPEAAPGEPLAPAAVDGRSMAYVIYTSGTTGRPKGTAVEHGALAQYVAGAVQALELPEGADCAMVSTFAADLGSTMLFPALCTGGTLHLVPEALATDPEGWAEYAEAHGIDAMKVVPSHLRLLLDAAAPERALPRVRLVLGGEAADWGLVDRVRSLAPGCRVINHYGPTETTVGVLAGALVDAADATRPTAPPLGRPLPGTRVYLLDGMLRPLPGSVPGEIHVGGGSVARGYVGSPGLTADRFLPDPFGAPGSRMYRTGDRARWLADGWVEFLGRTDDQVKVAGHRVEPAEVAAVLAAHPAVRECRVIARREGELVRLTACVVPAGAEEPTAAELRHWLAERLPEPMVPSTFLVLPRLPITPNGKLDLQALAAAAERSAPARGGAPRTDVEARVARLFGEVLGTAEAGVEDDFFLLGGNSFLAVRLMSGIQKEFGRRMPLAVLVGAATVERVAALLAEAEAKADEHDHLVPLSTSRNGTPLFCVHPGQGTVLCYRSLAEHLRPSFPMYGVQALDFELGRDPITRIEEMAARYVEAVGRRHAGPVRLAGWSFGGLVAYEMARQFQARGTEVERLVLFDCRLPITAPALRRADPALFRLGMLFDPRILVAEDGTPRVAGAELQGLPLQQQLALVSRRTGIPAEALVPAHVPAERLERYLALRMARTEAVLAYGWQPYGGRITLFRAGDLDLDTPFPELREAYLRAADTLDYGWGPLTPHPVKVLTVPGNHGSMFDEPHVRALAAAMERLLAPHARAPR